MTARPSQNPLARLFLPRRVSRRTVLQGAAAGAGALLLRRTGLASAHDSTGPSTSVPSYVVPTVNGVVAKALITSKST